MKSIVSVMLALLFAIPADAAKVEGRGQEWLDEHKDAPQVNITGSWQSPDWGTMTLTQAEGSREVSGSDRRFALIGVVMCRLGWKWRTRSSVKITERAREENTKALHRGRESRHLEAAFAGAGASFQAL